MERQVLVGTVSLLLLIFSSPVQGQDMCDKLFNKYHICIEQRDAGSIMDYDVCKGCTNQFTCEFVGCYWNADKSVCTVNLCLMDGSLDGKVNTTDLGIYKKEFARIDCPITPEGPPPLCITCEGALSALGRWCDQGNGTVKDMTTGLVWLQDAVWGGPKPWEDCTTHDDAHTRAGTLYDGMAGEPSSLSDGSVWGDWRLPTMSELLGIGVGEEFIRSDPSQMYFFYNVQNNYWSSTTNAYAADYAMFVAMTNGSKEGAPKSGNAYVWPVRGGQ